MKKATGVFLLLAIAVLSSCEFGKPNAKNKPDIFTDTLAYTYKTLHERAADCGTKADDSCTVAKIKYPVFAKAPVLNDTVIHRLTFLFPVYSDGSKPDTGLTQMVKHFLKGYTDFKKSTPSSQMYYTMDYNAKVIFQDSALVSLEYGGYTFQGGAHGATITAFINWNPKTNTNMLLKDILADGYHEKLTRIADTIFRKNEKLTDTSSLATNYFFKDGKFALNDNYSLTPLGIKFLYNQYEIKPYAAGQTELFIPYDKLKTLIRPGSVIAQFIKK